MANKHSDLQSTGASVILRQGIPDIGKHQEFSPSRSFGYHPVQTGALVLSALPWLVPDTSRLESERESQEAMEDKFTRLATTWKAETGMLSRLDQKYMHPAYQQIIGMGKAAIPFILRDLKRAPGHWFWALRAITGESPVPQEAAGDIDKVIEAWLEWGRKKGYVT